MVNLEEWYKSIPVITRTYMTLCLLTTMAAQLEFVTPFVLYLNFNTIFQNYQLWRLLTTFVFFDYFNLNFLFHMFFTIEHSRKLEANSFRGRTGDYFFMWLFLSVLLLSSQLFIHYFPILSFMKAPFLAPCLAFSVVYVWSRRSRDSRISFLGLFTFTAPYLPWVILVFGILLGQPLLQDLLGLAAGHIYYFLEDVYPTITNRRILKTPQIIKSFFDDQADIIPAQVIADNPNPNPPDQAPVQ
eukprot:TRINITY_DN15437_c0_g1_i1.p1 TRINITY_DN15437_c0_g1~~TRINITY_DN15437_c0_g1_i1.p1  ORF type:complete len:258 (-),score=24.04 TRINITY_DN15437_c0_g1_i1:60-788(-)